MSFIFTPVFGLSEVITIEGPRFEDERGFFSESFRSNDFEAHGIPPFVQENHSYSTPFCFRGLHYQLNPYAQGKLVYCVSGAIWDFVVDIRQGSPTYGKWAKIKLWPNEGLRMVYVPPGFAHGFHSVGTENSHVIYKVTDYYSPDHERNIKWDDPKIGIVITGVEKIADKDANAPLLKDAENNFVYEDE